MSVYSLAKNLLRALVIRSVAGSPNHHGEEDHTHLSPGDEDILGRCYERRTRVRQPIASQPLTQRDGGIYAIYSSLACPDLVEPLEVLYVWREGGRYLGPRALRYCMYGGREGVAWVLEP